MKCKRCRNKIEKGSRFYTYGVSYFCSTSCRYESLLKTPKNKQINHVYKHVSKKKYMTKDLKHLAWDIFSHWCKMRDSYICYICGKDCKEAYYEKPPEERHRFDVPTGSHFFNKGVGFSAHPSLVFDERNVDCVCWGCHSRHENKAKFSHSVDNSTTQLYHHIKREQLGEEGFLQFQEDSADKTFVHTQEYLISIIKKYVLSSSKSSGYMTLLKDILAEEE